MAILFDLDGTLIDTADDIISAISNLGLEINKPIPNYKLLRDHISFGVEKLLSIAFNIDSSQISKEELSHLKTRFMALYRELKFKTSKLFFGIELLIDNLKENNLKVGIVTNKSLELAIPVLNKVRLINKIDCLVTSDMVPNPKPFPDSVLLAIKTLEARPEDCLFIGDAEQDILAGNAAGIKTAVAMFGYVGDPKIAKNWPASYFLAQPTDIWPLVSALYNVK